MEKIIIGTSVAISLLLNGNFLAFANDGVDGKAIEAEARAVDVQSAVKERSDAFKQALKDREEAIKNVFEQRRAMATTSEKEAMESARKDFQKRIESAKEEFVAKREAAKEELKNELTKIKDEHKKQLVESLNDRFTEINLKLTNHWLDTVDRLENALNRIISRADKTASKGVDVTAVRAAIEKAKTAIAGAKTDLETQLTKSYPIAVTNENTLKSAVATARQMLNNDLKTVKEAVRQAYQAVVDALTLLKAVPKVDEDATSTPNNH